MVLRRIGLSSVLLLLALCSPALAAQQYRDPVGDVKGGAGPDLVAVTLSNTASTLTFRVRFAHAPPLRVSQQEKWVDMLLIGIDVPPLGPPPVTAGGEWPGMNFALGTHGPSATGLLVRPGSMHGAPPVRFKIVRSGATLSFSIPRRPLGGARTLAFSVAAAREGESPSTGGGFDVAPGRGTFRYRFS